MQKSKLTKRITRKKRIRSKVVGTTERPRVSIFRSNKFIYGQVIDDVKAQTLVSSSGKNASEVGEKLATSALKKKIKRVVFDRGGYRYQGKVQKFAKALREKGLEF